MHAYVQYSVIKMKCMALTIMMLMMMMMMMMMTTKISYY